MIERLTDEQLEDLVRRKPEQCKVDLKQDIHVYASDQTKARFVKDIMAFANAHEAGSGYIIYGVKEKDSNPWVGISHHHDDAQLQQLVEARLNRLPEFLYYEVEHQGVDIGVAMIAKGLVRPYYPKNDFDILREGQAFIRKGSRNVVADESDYRLFEAVRGGSSAKQILESMKTDSLASALMQARELARSIGAEEDAKWMTAELVGYEEGSELPHYRMIGCYASGAEIAGLGYMDTESWMRQQPDKFVPQKLATGVSVARIEQEAARHSNPAGMFFLKREGYFLYFFPREYSGILDGVKTRLIGFLARAT